MSFWVKTNKTIQRRSDGGDNLQIGTYIRPHNTADAAWQGDHYYHLLDPNYYADQWMLIELNRVPQHQVGQNPGTNWPENPSAPGVNYFDGLTLFYFDSQGAEFENTVWLFDDYNFETESGEPDSLISSIAVTYSGTRYEVSWAGPKNTTQVYDVRYSPTSMKPNSFTSGTDGGTVQNPGSAYTGTFWASPAMAQANTLYIAIRPQGQSAFTEIKFVKRGTVVPPAGDFQLAHMQYLGAFRVPDGATDPNSFNYGGEDLVFNPYGPNGGTLRMTGHDQYQKVAEVSIPTPVNSSNINSLPTAQLVQNFFDPVDGRIEQIDPLPESNSKKIGGELIDDFNNDGTPEVLTNAYVFYDADTSATGSTFLSKSLTLSDTTDAVGPFRPQGINPGYIAGYMAKVPSSLQAELGTKYVTGQCNISIIGRSSMGPALFGFDPVPMLAANPNMTFPVSNLASYPHDDTPFESQVAFNETTNMFNYMSSIDGVFFHEETDSVVFVGDQKMGNICYKGNRPNCPDTGGWNSDGPQVGGLWIYKGSELEKVRNGTLAPNEVMPSDWIQFDFPISGNQQASGVAFDPATRRLFIAQYGADRKTGFGYSPVIHVYHLSGTTTSNPPLPGGGGADPQGNSEKRIGDKHVLLAKPGEPAEVDCPSGCDITIFNRFGNEVFKTSGSGLVPLVNSILPSGSYKIRIDSGDHREIKNFVIVR